MCYCLILDVTAHQAEGLVVLTTILAQRSVVELSLAAGLQGALGWRVVVCW